MEKETQMPPTAKQVMIIYEAALSGYFLFSYFGRGMDTEKQFSLTGEVTGTSVMISGK